MFKNKNLVLQALSISLLCSPWVQAMETQALAAQQAFPPSTLCPQITATCAAPHVTEHLAKRYTAVRPIPSATAAPLVGQKTAELIKLQAFLDQKQWIASPYTLHVPKFIQMDDTQVESFLAKFGYNIQQRWQQILSALEISDNQLTERFIAACETIANEIEQFAQLALFYKILELKGPLLERKYFWGRAMDEITYIQSNLLCSSAGHPWHTNADLATLTNADSIALYTANRMLAIGACLANTVGITEQTMFTTIQSFIKDDLTFLDAQTAEFLQDASNSHSFVTVRSAAGNSTATTTVGDAYTLQDLLAPLQSSVFPKMLKLYADQFRRTALNKRFAANDSHIFDLPTMQFLLQEAPGVKEGGTVAVVCQSNSTIDYLGQSHTNCGLGSAAPGTITDGFYGKNERTLQTIRVKPVPSLVQNNGTLALKPTPFFTTDATLEHDEQIIIQNLLDALTPEVLTANNVRQGYFGQQIRMEFVVDKSAKRIYITEVRPYDDSTGNGTAPARDPLTPFDGPLYKKPFDYHDGDKYSLGWYTDMVWDGKDSPLLGNYTSLSHKQLIQHLTEGRLERITALSALLANIKKERDAAFATAPVKEIEMRKLEKKTGMQKYLDKTLIMLLVKKLYPQTFILQPELVKLQVLFNNILGAAVNFSFALYGWSPKYDMDSVGVLKLNANLLESFVLQTPAAGVVNSISWQTTLDDYMRKIAFFDTVLKPLIESDKISSQFITDRSYFLRAFEGISLEQTPAQNQQWVIFLNRLLQMPQNEQSELLELLKGSRYEDLYECWKRSSLA